MICIPAETVVLVVALAIAGVMTWRTVRSLYPWPPPPICAEHGARDKSKCLQCISEGRA